MPEPISTIALVGLGCVALHAAARPGSAVSAEARVLRESASAVVESAERSVALFGSKATAISQIWALAKECAEFDWDGASGEPISLTAASMAADFIRALPDDIQLPEFAPEPDGSISLDWIQSRTRLFSLSAGTTNRLAYTWLDGTDRGHAVVRFDGQTVPIRIVEGIRNIVIPEHAAFRAA